MRAIKLNSRLSFAALCVLVSFIIPVTALAEEDCPCFTAEDVMAYASKPAKFVCIFQDSQGGVRYLIKGEYGAGFGVSNDDTPSGECSAYAGIGIDPPRVVFLEKSVYDITDAQFNACWDLINLGDPPDCL